MKQQSKKKPPEPGQKVRRQATVEESFSTGRLPHSAESVNPEQDYSAGDSPSSPLEVAPFTDLEIAQRNLRLKQEVAEVHRERLALRLGIDPMLLKPCIAMIGGQPEGQRERYCRVLALDLVKAGAAENVIVGYLGHFTEHCHQPPMAKKPFRHAEAAGVLQKVLERKKRGQRIYGYGCGVKNGSSPLLPYCPYGAPEGRYSCSYVQGLMRPPKREKITSLVGATLAMFTLPVPPEWSEGQRDRRRLLWLMVGVLENLKGHGGILCITSERELAYYAKSSRSTVCRDLREMAAAQWVEFKPGLPWKASAGLPKRGCQVRRLLAEDSMAKEAAAVFPGASVEGESGLLAHWPTLSRALDHPLAHAE